MVIKAYSQRVLQPYSGQIQIAEWNDARAVSLDGERWKFQFFYSETPGAKPTPAARRRLLPWVAYYTRAELPQIAARAPGYDEDMDGRVVALAGFIAEARLPFPAADRYECWLLDPRDDSPLALMFSCTDKSYFDVYPPATEWVALPAILMPIETSEAERSRYYGPVNYRFECCVAERAGTYPKARWFVRGVDDEGDFPALLVREDWDDEESHDLCQRYLNRQSPRLLMLHGLSHDARKRMESAAKAHALDVERYFPLYPEVIDQHAMDGIRVEARLRRAAGEQAYTVANTLR